MSEFKKPEKLTKKQFKLYRLRRNVKMLHRYIHICQTLNAKLEAAYFKQLMTGLLNELVYPQKTEEAGKTISDTLGDLPYVTDTDNLADAYESVIQPIFKKLYDTHATTRNNVATQDVLKDVRAVDNIEKSINEWVFEANNSVCPECESIYDSGDAIYSREHHNYICTECMAKLASNDVSR